VELARRKEQDAEDERQASQYQTGSIAGKMLMNKCKDLQIENDQLGKELSEGQVQELRAGMLLQNDYMREVRKALVETRDWVGMLSGELDTSQALVLLQRRQLKNTKRQSLGGGGGQGEPAGEYP